MSEEEGGSPNGAPREEPVDQGAAAPPRVPLWRRLPLTPREGIALAGGLVTLIAVNALLLNLSQADRAEPAPLASGAAPSLVKNQETASILADAGGSSAPSTSASVAAEPAPSAAPPSPNDDPAPDEPPAHDKPGKKEKGHTVQWAAERACSTSHVDGLSRQIVEEARSLDASAFARIPPRKNLSSAGHVFLYLDAPARDHLLRALDAHPDRVLKVHSALRTVAQQYLLSRWAAGRRCGIQLATRPGESNHETGLALDVASHGLWQSALESEGFRWLGSIDRVHFDFVGAGATHHDGLDVRAFQRLWNRNHPDDGIAENGKYDSATEQRLRRSPAAGFPIGAHHGGGQDHRVASGGSGRARGR